MVSIIVVTYNMLQTLPRCVQSIMAQTYQDIEIIVVNDGSTDGTAEYLARYPKIKTINQTNLGLSEGRNVGLANASGEYIYFIDADDYIHPRTIEVLLHTLLFTQSDMAIGNLTRKSELPINLDTSYEVYTQDEALHILTDYTNRMFTKPRQLCFNATWNKLYKRECLTGIQFPKGILSEDNFTVHRIFGNVNRVVFVNGITYSYTNTPNSMAKMIYNTKDMMLAFMDRIKWFRENQKIEFLPSTYAAFLNVCLTTYDHTHDFSVIEEAQAVCSECKDVVLMNRVGAELYRIVMGYKTIIIYQRDNSHIDGMNIWTRNFVKMMQGRYLIKVLSERPATYNPNATYKCNILLHNYSYDAPKSNIMADKTFIVLHCDYENIVLDPKYQYIAVSEIVGNKLGITAIEGLMEKKPKKQRVLKLISATRLSENKGYKRMIQLGEALNQKGICFQWLIFNDVMPLLNRGISVPNMFMCGKVDHDTLLQYMADADYVVQLSDSEGFGNVVHESLMVGTPVIVTDIPIFNVVQDGANGYKVSLDMNNLDIDKIVTTIPKGFTYENNIKDIRSKWNNLLREDDIFGKPNIQ